MSSKDARKRRRGLKQAATRQDSYAYDKSLNKTKPLPKPKGKDGQRVFTPANRAAANLRRVRRPGRMLVEGSAATTRSLPGSNKYSTALRVPRTRTPEGDIDTYVRNIEFDHIKGGGQYKSNRDLGKKTSKVKAKRDKESIKALVGRSLDEAEPGDIVKASPTTRSRGALYQRATKGALRTRPVNPADPKGYQDIAAKRQMGNYWVDMKTGERTRFNPKDLEKGLEKLSESKATLVGRRAGGTSNIKGRLKVREAAPRGVGANGRPTLNPARPQPGRRLGGPNKNIKFNRVYHGTSANSAQNIRANGYRQSPTGVFGPGVYTGNKKMAQQYADSAGRANGSGGRVLAHRVPAKNSKTVQFEKGNNPRVSPQKGLVQDRLRQGKTTRINYGNGSHVTNLTKAQADRSLIPANGQMRVTPRQQAAARRGGLQSRLSINNVQRSEPGYFKPGSRTVDTKKAADLIESQVKGMKKGGGFTVDPRTGRVPTRGTQVAVDGRVLRDTSRAGIERFVQKNKELLSRPDTKVGGWTSDRSGKPVVELSRRVRSQAEAERLGRKFQQEGVYSNQRGQVTSTGGSDQLRHTRGAQTKGGGRIGGKGATAQLRVKPQPGVVKAAARPVAKAATQSLQQQGTKQLVKGVTGVAGRALGPAMTAIDYKDRRDQGQSRVRAGGGALSGAAGGWAGAKGGAATGAALGTAIAPGLGTAIGSVLGGLAGGTAGYMGGNALHDAAYRPAPKRTQSQQEKNRLKLQRHRRR